MFSSSRKHKKLPIPFRPRLEILEDRTLLSVCTVDRLTDVGEGSGLAGDLRYCITRAQDRDKITFTVTGTINLTRALPFLTHSIRIGGPGADLLTVRRDTGGQYPIFSVAGGTTIILSGLTISNGYGPYGGGISNGGTLTLTNSTVSGNYSAQGGGGIDNGQNSTMTVTNSTIAGNSAQQGGGIYNGDFNTVTITNSTIAGNSASIEGGGMVNGFYNTVRITNSTISGNSAQFSAGGIFNYVYSTVTITNSTISGNSTKVSGGGIYNEFMTTVTITNSTLSDNSAKVSGGGIYNRGGQLGMMTITNSTLSGNSAQVSGGGIYNSGTGVVRSRNTLVAGNTAPTGPDLGGPLGSLGHNLVGDSQDGSGFDPTDLLDIDPMLGPLQDNGGPTQTMALLPGSPAVDAGDNTNAPAFDQRGEGFDRIVGGTIDIGAFEAQIGSAISFRIDTIENVQSGTPFDMKVVALDAYNHLATGYTGTVTFSTTDPDKGVVLPADYTFTPDDSGYHIFTDTGLGETTLITPGDQTITVKDTKDETVTGNAIVTVMGGNGPRMGRGNLNGGNFNWIGSAFGSPINRKGSVNSENYFFMDVVLDF